MSNFEVIVFFLTCGQLCEFSFAKKSQFFKITIVA